jgi:hypothetical protein
MLITDIASTIKTALLRNLRSNQQVVHNSAVFRLRALTSRCSAIHNHWNLWHSNYMKQIHSSEAGRCSAAFYGPMNLHYNNYLRSTPKPILKQIIQVRMFTHDSLRPKFVLFFSICPQDFYGCLRFRFPSFSDSLRRQDCTSPSTSTAIWTLRYHLAKSHNKTHRVLCRQ